MVVMTVLEENNLDIPETLARLKNRLSEGFDNPDSDFWQELSAEVADQLATYQASGEELWANVCWFLKTVCETRGRFVNSINAIKKGEYFSAWCELERVEIDSMLLLRNAFLDEKEFEVSDLLELIQSWQKTYPYKWFMSPEILHKSVQCGICSRQVTPWGECEHEPGRIYNGVCCHHAVVDVEFVSFSFVQNPVQKYSAIHIRKDEHGHDVEIYKYDIVRFVAERVRSPFDRFQVMWTKLLHPHNLFADRERKGPCPCESGRSYSDCCLENEGVLRPHMQITFAKEPAGNLPNAELVGYGEWSGAAALMGPMPENGALAGQPPQS